MRDGSHLAFPMNTQADSADPHPGPWIQATTKEAMATTWTVREHTISADEPAEAGGEDSGPTPVETMLGALAACTTITARMYADRKGWPVESVSARARRADSGEPGAVAAIELEIEILGDQLTDEQRARIKTIAGRCPVHRTLSEGAEVRTR